MADEVIASMDCDWQSVARTMTGPCPTGAPVWYQKHMAHHMVGPIAHDDLAGPPPRLPDPRSGAGRRKLRRQARSRPARASGGRTAGRIFRARGRPAWACATCHRQRRHPSQSAGDARAALRSARHCVGIRQCCSWEPGLRETDGIWASHWYDAVAASTGFGPPDDLSCRTRCRSAARRRRCRPITNGSPSIASGA